MSHQILLAANHDDEFEVFDDALLEGVAFDAFWHTDHMRCIQTHHVHSYATTEFAFGGN